MGALKPDLRRNTKTDLTAPRDVRHRRLLTVTGVTGIAYTVSWIAGLAVAAPSPKLTASGASITAALAGHQAAVVAQFALTEGLPAVGLAVISIALARAARRSGAGHARVALVAGLAAALISLAQFVLGAILAAAASPAAAHLLYESVNRLDGVKMLALAVLGLAGATSGVLPRWLRYAGITLAVAITCSAAAYLLLLPGLASLAYVSGPLLLLFVTGTGVVLG
jgi:hypothetical protein